MNRRRFLATGLTAGAGVTLSTATGCGPGGSGGGATSGGGTITTQASTELLVKFVGLNAFVQDRGSGGYEVGLVNATGVPLPPYKGNPASVHEHSALLAVQKTSYISHTPAMDPLVALDPTLLELQPGKWYLKNLLPTTEFYVWKLKGLYVTFKGIRPDIDPVESRVGGAIPLTEVSGKSLKKDWQKKADVVDAVVSLEVGLLREGRARTYYGNTQNRKWKIEDVQGKPSNGVSRKMTDIVDYEVGGDAGIEIGWRSLNGTTQTGSVTVSSKALVLVLHLPSMMADIEKAQWYILHHARAYYRMLEGADFSTEAKLAEMAIPRCNPNGGLQSDPVFCPPAAEEGV